MDNMRRCQKGGHFWKEAKGQCWITKIRSTKTGAYTMYSRLWHPVACGRPDFDLPGIGGFPQESLLFAQDFPTSSLAANGVTWPRFDRMGPMLRNPLNLGRA